MGTYHTGRITKKRWINFLKTLKPREAFPGNLLMKEVPRALTAWWHLYDSSSKRMHYFSAGKVERMKKQKTMRLPWRHRLSETKTLLHFLSCCRAQRGSPAVFDLPDFIETSQGATALQESPCDTQTWQLPWAVWNTSWSSGSSSNYTVIGNHLL